MAFYPPRYFAPRYFAGALAGGAGAGPGPGGPPVEVLTVGGVVQDLDALDAILVRCTPYAKGGVPTLEVQRRAQPWPQRPDPWLGQEVALAIDGVTIFRGDCTSARPNRAGTMWNVDYHCEGLRRRGDSVPIWDDNSGTDVVECNLEADQPDYLASRAGRTVGEVVGLALTQAKLAAKLDALGIGAYAALGPDPALPASTLADLAALAVVPPQSLAIQGERALTALEGFLQANAPNHALHVDPESGAIRVLDTRAFAAETLTLDLDPIEPTYPAADLRECYPRVVVRGVPVVEPAIVSTLWGTLAEDFGYGSVSNATAKATWTLKKYLQAQTAADSGSCTCTTTTVTVDPTAGDHFWVANFWDQTATGRKGTIFLTSAAATGIRQVTSRRIVSHTALSPGGTSVLTLEGPPLEITSYNQYEIRGEVDPAALTWRRYKVVDPEVAAAMRRRFSRPVAFRNASGTAATLTTYPTASVRWGNGFEMPMGFVFDPDAGTITFDRPVVVLTEGDQTKLLDGDDYATPTDVVVALAVAKGELLAVEPPDLAGLEQYEGTCHAIEGLSRTLYVHTPAWREPANRARMQAYARDILDSVKDTVLELGVTYRGLYQPALTFGLALNLAGDGYATGLEAAALPVLECTLRWPQGEGTNHVTEMALSNRRAHYSAAFYLEPGPGLNGFAGGLDLDGLAAGLGAPGGLGGFDQGGGQGQGDPLGGDFGAALGDYRLALGADGYGAALGEYRQALGGGPDRLGDLDWARPPGGPEGMGMGEGEVLDRAAFRSQLARDRGEAQRDWLEAPGRATGAKALANDQAHRDQSEAHQQEQRRRSEAEDARRRYQAELNRRMGGQD